ncbi:hypothetical protein DXH95_03180 [Sphingorhabdus pulchriflava]|uniref:Uncharacterized protein n=1 Tax=Sphingorhabdus pulchriflava TaxID=2292257 RepID=A0A371BFT0_9SPHN|nr:hypothetical protein [Sphingorhabdus pulchriflava]RDV06444.1 hypothetical protein DXH95_03180 [Sphingorhabdus pulchriflava]
MLKLRRYLPDPPLILRRVGADNRLAAQAQRSALPALPAIVAVGQKGNDGFSDDYDPGDLAAIFNSA